ncbi:MAG TPA: acido-empty-quinoprotein group A [Vicinamibacterales bacterium]|nr:acido-empty-quinoprotein group A [Vicinamibacterales bacterium]
MNRRTSRRKADPKVGLYRLLAVAVMSATLSGQQAGLDPATILKPLSDGWPSYSGDYTGRRYSALRQINTSNVKNLTLAWTVRLNAGPNGAGPGVTAPYSPRAPRTITGGVGNNEFVGGTTVKGSILAVDDVLYVTAPDNVWALDANDGHLLWHYFWRTKGGTHIGNRGAAMWRNNLYFVTPDCYLVSLDARTGEERWHKEIASFNQQYFCTSAPTVVENQVIVGTGNDLDSPGYLLSFDALNGDVKWKFYAVPMNPGDPGLDSWKDLDAARNGGGHPWIPGSYDPETRLYIFGTGNPTPAYTDAPRGAGDNLFTNSVVAVNIDTGKMAWYYQTNPHDTHDWDSAQTPILVDGEFNGKPRKLVVTAARNGYYFTLDRLTGERLVTSKFSDTVNWASGINGRGQPVRIPEKDHHIGGALVSSNNGGATNWPPQAYSPDTGLVYVPLAENYAMYYLTELDPRGAMGLGGKDEVGVSGVGSYIAAIDYKTGKTVWRHKFATSTPSGRGSPGLLATAGRLLFGGDVSGNFVAFDAGKGTPLWHARIGQVSNAPQTYLVGGRQHVLVAAGDTLYAFALY